MIVPKKHLGQHFLTDDNIARKIVAALPEETRTVVEVGPGTGVLTRHLLEEGRHDLFLYEIDRESVAYLHQHYPQLAGRITGGDFLECDLSVIPAPFAVIGNFPYNISSQILFRVLEYRDRIPEVVGMFQKEVAERIASPPGSKKYGILSVLLQAWYTIDYLFTVNETVFYPPPKVKSAVIRLRRNSVMSLDCDEELFFRVVKTAFNQRRKTLRNALKPLGSLEDPAVTSLLGLRAEQLSVKDFVAIAASLQR